MTNASMLASEGEALLWLATAPSRALWLSERLGGLEIFIDGGSDRAYTERIAGR